MVGIILVAFLRVFLEDIGIPVSRLGEEALSSPTGSGVLGSAEGPDRRKGQGG